MLASLFIVTIVIALGKGLWRKSGR